MSELETSRLNAVTFQPSSSEMLQESSYKRISSDSYNYCTTLTRNAVKKASEKLRGSQSSTNSGSDMIMSNKYSSSYMIGGSSISTRGDAHGIPYLPLVYAGACFTFIAGYFIFHDAGFSTILTVGACIDFFAFCSLVLNVLWRQSTAGVSKKMLTLEFLVRAFRLSSTLFFRGYLPADSTGSGAFQLCDIGTLICTLLILASTTAFRTEEQEEQDMNFPMKSSILICLTTAIIIHPGLNNNMVFDTAWTFSLYLNVVSMLPQLMMIKKVKEEMDALSVHFVAAITLSRFLNAIFWYYAFEELAPINGGYNVSGYFVITALCAQVGLMMDFGYYYIKALLTRGKYYRRGGVFGSC